MPKAKLVYEFVGSRNLNTTPIDITGLQGDLYDYELIAFFEIETGVNSPGRIFFNNDTGANYRNYAMWGVNATAAAAVGDSNAFGVMDFNAQIAPALSITKITGDSSGERLMDMLGSLSAGGSIRRIRKTAQYWKNTVDELTSIQLSKSVSVTSNCHILLYRTLKTTSQGNWERIGELNWAAEATEKSFTGLDGDRDKKYRIVYEGDQNFNVEINNNNGAVYTRQSLTNSAGSLAAANTTTDTRIVAGKTNSEIIINAETGSNRLCLVSYMQPASVNQSERGVWYRETVTNITTIDCTPSSSATGKATLYRMKSGTQTDGVLPWELIQEVDINGDFNVGHTFTGLTGDSEKLYRVEFLGNTATTSLRILINGDTTANQVYQLLEAVSSTAQASTSTTFTAIPFTPANSSQQVSGELILYPKSGTQRPTLTKAYTRENIIRLMANWWPNTVDEITSLVVHANNTTAMTGKLKLWRLK